MDVVLHLGILSFGLRVEVALVHFRGHLGCGKMVILDFGFESLIAVPGANQVLPRVYEVTFRIVVDEVELL